MPFIPIAFHLPVTAPIFLIFLLLHCPTRLSYDMFHYLAPLISTSRCNSGEVLGDFFGVNVICDLCWWSTRASCQPRFVYFTHNLSKFTQNFPTKTQKMCICVNVLCEMWFWYAPVEHTEKHKSHNTNHRSHFLYPVLAENLWNLAQIFDFLHKSFSMGFPLLTNTNLKLQITKKVIYILIA